MPSLKLETEVTITECASCAGPIGLTINQERNLRLTGIPFYCPMGHINSWSQARASELAKAQDTITALETQVANRDAELIVVAKKVSALNKAASKGQCIHCERYFSDLHRHVRRMHE